MANGRKTMFITLPKAMFITELLQDCGVLDRDGTESGWETSESWSIRGILGVTRSGLVFHQGLKFSFFFFLTFSSKEVSCSNIYTKVFEQRHIFV